MNNIEKIVKRITTDIANIERFGWPPECYGMLYQPERPTASNPTAKETQDKDS